jgi:hypothetical protein
MFVQGVCALGDARTPRRLITRHRRAADTAAVACQASRIVNLRAGHQCRSFLGARYTLERGIGRNRFTIERHLPERLYSSINGGLIRRITQAHACQIFVINVARNNK